VAHSDLEVLTRSLLTLPPRVSISRLRLERGENVVLREQEAVLPAVARRRSFVARTVAGVVVVALAIFGAGSILRRPGTW
jgi:hypothetical protein